MSQTPERNGRIRGDRFIPTKVSRALFSGVEANPNISDASKGYYQALRNELLGEESEKSVFTYEGNTPSRSNHPYSNDCDNSPCTSDAGLTASSPEPTTPRQKLCLASSSSPLPVTPPKYLPKGMEFPVSPNRSVTREKPWKSPNKPYRILDAPGLLDDFYTDILDLGPDRRLCVSLSNQIYLYHIDTATVNNLPYTDEACVTSVKWAGSNTVAVGTTEGSILLIDVTAEKIIHRTHPHTHRVGCMAWCHSLHLLASGAQDGTMIWSDIRTNTISLQTIHHSDDVCGLRWSHDGQYLASGSNDNELCVWSANLTEKPLMSHRHNAAVRGLAWSPHTHGLLVSGGGASDRRMMFFSTSSGTCINEVNTGAQVCCLHWSLNSNEIVSSHGHQSTDVFIWKYPKLVPHTKLEGHTCRVLWICASTPDGETLVTASGDETIRFWNAFPPRKSSPTKPTSSLLSCISIR